MLVVLATCANTRPCPLFRCEMVDVCSLWQLLNTLSACVSQRAPQTSIGHSSQLSHIPPTPLPKRRARGGSSHSHSLHPRTEGGTLFIFPDRGSISGASRHQQEACILICKIPQAAVKNQAVTLLALAHTSPTRTPAGSDVRRSTEETFAPDDTFMQAKNHLVRGRFFPFCSV